MLVEDVKWFVRTCHECQIRQSCRLHIPPTVPVIGGLFRKVHLDTMVMPRSAGYQYIVQARCALTAYPEWQMLRSENASALASFIFEDILCRWGALAEIVTDNGPAFVQALDVLTDRYNIRHICISPYNSQANGVVERRHLDVREAIIKSTPGGEFHWHTLLQFFLFSRRLSLASLPCLRTVLRNALHLNTASFLRAVHGSLIPFPLAFYGCPSHTRVYLNAVSSLLLHHPSLPFISTTVLMLRTLLGPCTT